MIAVPLLPGDPDVPLDLQAAFDRAYQAGHYARAVHYGRDPIAPPLTEEQAVWVEALIRRAPTSPP